ncbi:hypothetical protein V1511DRAFT_443951, partial [Dipodascopsis uninucleata]
DVPSRPPTPEGSCKPILLPNELVLQIFPKKYCVFREEKIQKGGFFSFTEPEYFHTYLTKKSMQGSLWITTTRIIFVPNSPKQKGASVDILDVKDSKAIESDMQVWFYLAHTCNHLVVTVPFSSELRVKAFMKLIANLRFEHKVRQSLPPPYRRRSESLHIRRTLSIDSTNTNGSTVAFEEDALESDEEAEEEEEEDWERSDDYLPSYKESEDAVERYLIDRGLLNRDGSPIVEYES